MDHTTAISKLGFMRRTNRLLLSGALALLLGASVLAFPAAQAYAADGSVTINSADPAANTGATYKAYVFFTANIDDKNTASGITWALSNDKRDALITFLGDDYTTWLTDNKHTETDAAKSSANAAEFISSSIGSSAGINAPRWVDGSSFASSLAKWAITNLEPTASAEAGKEFTASEGYYLFVTNTESLSVDEMGTAPIWFPLGGSSTTIEEKAAVPSIKKEVQEDSTSEWGKIADAEMGQDVNYRITVTMPNNLNTFDTFFGKVEDILPAGMTLSTDDVEIKLGETDITDKFAISFTEQKLTATCNNLKAIDGVIAGSSIVVTYKAHFTKTPAPVYGGGGNSNTATFAYSNDPNSTTQGLTHPVAAKAYIYQIKINKYDMEKTQLLSGAQFVIRNSDKKYLNDAGVWVDDKAQAERFTSNADGVAMIPGLDEGAYVINEVAAPSGYKIYDGDIAVSITSAFDDNDVLTLGAKVSGGLTGTALVEAGVNASAGTIEIDVSNQGVVLAMSGAQGVGLGGAAVVIIGVVWYVIRRRKNASEDEQ